MFAKLSGADQRLVLSGRVSDGMTAEAVFIALGDPDEKWTAGTGKDAAERWLYRRQLTVKAPLGDFDQWSRGNRVFGLTAPLAVSAGFGFGGVGDEGGLLYQPHLQIPDAAVKEVDLRDGRVERCHVDQGEFTLPR